MSKCFNEPGPVTTVHGYVNDVVTGKPLSNVQLQVVSQFGYGQSSGNYVTTAADGSFYLKFTPSSSSGFYLKPALAQQRRYYFTSPYPRLVLGQDNNFTLTAYKFVAVGIHLINNSNQNRSDFTLNLKELNPTAIRFEAFFDLAPPKADTIFSAFLLQQSSYQCQSYFFNGYTTAGFADSVNFYKTITLGANDTTVVITNP